MEAKGQVEVAAPSARTVKRRVLRAQTTARGERRGCTRQRKKPLAGEPRRSALSEIGALTTSNIPIRTLSSNKGENYE